MWGSSCARSAFASISDSCDRFLRTETDVNNQLRQPDAPDPNIGAAYIASKTEALQLLLAHRPNVSYPTFAAKTFATVDQVSDGRMTVHFITGGTDHEQQREGDYLTKDERYERTRECMQIVKKAWTSRAPFDYQGKHYKFADFVSDVFPVQQPRPRLSFGGSSPAAYQAGGAEADIYCLWGEPLARTAEQIESVRRAAREAGRADTPKIQVAFRPIIAPTEAQAWEKAHDIVARIEARVQASGGALTRRRPIENPENTGSQRLIAIAEEGERFDRALWTRTAAVTGGAGNSNALVGTPETVARHTRLHRPRRRHHLDARLRPAPGRGRRGPATHPPRWASASEARAIVARARRTEIRPVAGSTS